MATRTPMRTRALADLKCEVYEDAEGEWRWRVRARNNRIVADSGEGYVRRSGARKAMLRLVFDFRRGVVVLP